jgi:hypothetical protein
MKYDPWNREELEYLIPKLEEKLDRVEEEQRDSQLHGQEEVRPMPPMEVDECVGYLIRLVDAASKRPLTSREIFMHGQLLCVFKQAVMAEMLGKKGRYVVVSEDGIAQILTQVRVN